jgi:bidirectional [NiFe] hydrogenase diaphorase subunit
MVKSTSLCGLGQSAPNPVLTTLKYFQEEYQQLLQSNGQAEQPRQAAEEVSA